MNLFPPKTFFTVLCTPIFLDLPPALCRVFNAYSIIDSWCIVEWVGSFYCLVRQFSHWFGGFNKISGYYICPAELQFWAKFTFWVLQFSDCALVTQPMLQLRPNQTELRLMDLYNQILCRFQKCKRKVSPPSLPPFKKKKTSFKSTCLWK